MGRVSIAARSPPWPSWTWVAKALSLRALALKYPDGRMICARASTGVRCRPSSERTSAARIRARTPQPDGSEVLDADLVISFKVFREKFGSRVTLIPQERRIDVAYLDGPFRYLNNHWKFDPREDGGCDVDFFVDFEFRSIVLQKLIGVVFNEAMQRIVRAFETRAEALYGPG